MSKSLKFALKYNNGRNYDLNKLVARIIMVTFVVILFHYAINIFFDVRWFYSCLILSALNTIKYSVKKYILNK